jgi:RNA polymerase sigma factor (TIGR02999 family)
MQTSSSLSIQSEHEPEALKQVFAQVYVELREMAHRLRRGRAGETLDTTGLVHEAFLRLADHTSTVRDRGHFFALAACVMRQVIVDFARERCAEKRGGGERPLTLVDAHVEEDQQASELLALDAALRTLAQIDARQAQVVECRYFAGLTEPETAEALNMSERSVQRDWHAARVWLRRTLA